MVNVLDKQAQAYSPLLTFQGQKKVIGAAGKACSDP
jgi:hypothetical protein